MTATTATRPMTRPDIDAYTPTLGELCQLEPRLRDLVARAAAIRDDGQSPVFCAHVHWYGVGADRGLRGAVIRLVGHEADSGYPIVRTSTAYDVAYRALYDLLPPCRGNCRCVR